MMSRWALIPLLALLAGVSMQSAPVGPAPQWAGRLESLHPSQPLAYFQLAEEVADAASNPAELELARHLFGLAGLLDTGRLGRSACYALADLAPDEAARDRYQVLAALLGRTTFASRRHAESNEGEVAVDELSAAVGLSEAFSYYRVGQGARALSAIRRPGARHLLLQLDHAIPGGSIAFLEDCKLYRGQNRPPLNDDELAIMLQIDQGLLAQSRRSWSAELLITRGRPLIDMDPDRLDEAFGIDPARSIYRSGHWIRLP